MPFAFNTTLCLYLLDEFGIFLQYYFHHSNSVGQVSKLLFWVCLSVFNSCRKRLYLETWSFFEHLHLRIYLMSVNNNFTFSLLTAFWSSITAFDHPGNLVYKTKSPWINCCRGDIWLFNSHSLLFAVMLSDHSCGTYALCVKCIFVFTLSPLCAGDCTSLGETYSCSEDEVEETFLWFEKWVFNSPFFSLFYFAFQFVSFHRSILS